MENEINNTHKSQRDDRIIIMIKPYHIKPRWGEIIATPPGFNCDFESQCYNIATPLGFNYDFQSQYYNIATPPGFNCDFESQCYNIATPLGFNCDFESQFNIITSNSSINI